jgi:acetyl esterase
MDAPMRHRALAALGVLLAIFVVGPATVGVVGTLLYEVPVLGLATGFVPPVMTWVVIATAAGGLLALAVAVLRRSQVAIAVVLVAALTAGGGCYVVARQVAAAEAAGVDVSLLDTLGVWTDEVSVPDALASYGMFEGTSMGVSVFEPRAVKGAPVLVFIHGGGWVAGERDANSSDFRWFADHGWLVFSVDYPLSSKGRHLWNVVDGQLGCALAWVAGNAARYGGDARRLSLSGDSAGGSLAINVAYMSANGTLRSACGGTQPAVSAVVTLYPAVDPASVFTNADFVLGTTARTFAMAYLGGPPDQVPDRYAAVASATHVSPAAPPTLMILGAADHLVPTVGAERLAAQARALGVDASVVSIPYADHVFDQRKGSIGEQTFRQLTAAWLRTHGQAP